MINRPMVQKRHSSISAVVALLILLNGCGRTTHDSSNQDAPYHHGQVETTVMAEAGPLHLELWRVDYEGGWEGQQEGTRLLVPTKTMVYLRVQNTAPVTTTVLHNQPPSEPVNEPPPPPAAFLRDDQGRRYAATGGGWSRTAETLDLSPGIVPPYATGEFWLTFDGIPRTVAQLTLVVPDLALDSGERYSVEIAVPLPEHGDQDRSR